MGGPYTFNLDREAGTWTCENATGTQIDSGDLPLTDTKRRKAVFSDHGVSDPTATALEEIWDQNWSDEEQ